jgi:hypothetical protein
MLLLRGRRAAGPSAWRHSSSAGCVMKALVIIAVLLGSAAVAYQYGPSMFSVDDSRPGVRMGQTVEEVEQVMGPALSVVPNFGNELRVYEGNSGKRAMFIFSGEGKLIEIKQ